MPLVFAVLIAIVIILNLKDSTKWNARQASLNEDYRRKTNARLEQKIMDSYMKRGYSADEAFKKSYEDMLAAGYDPCIPREAYGKNSSCATGRGKTTVEQFDSMWVRKRREAVIEDWLRKHPGKLPCHAPSNLIDAVVYNNFPTTEAAYLHDIERLRMRSQAEPIGTFIIYPGLGTCEILAHNWRGDGAAGGTYTLKVLKTGKVVTYVKIGDDLIRRQGQ